MRFRKRRCPTLSDAVAKKPPRKNGKLGKLIRLLADSNDIIASLRFVHIPRYKAFPVPGPAWKIVRNARGRGRKRTERYAIIGRIDDELMARAICRDLNGAAP